MGSANFGSARFQPASPHRAEAPSRPLNGNQPIAARQVAALKAAKPRWPWSVLQPLSIALQQAASQLPDPSLGDRRGLSPLHLVAGACQIPHPKKGEGGGEDSFFIAQTTDAVGVADGVGDWDRLQVNPRGAADELMEGARSLCEGMRLDMNLEAAERALAMLQRGYDSMRSYGATTAIIASVDASGSMLGVANLGDSGLRQLRKGYDGSMRIVGRTREQQHFFNCPFQLSRLPEPKDFPRLLAQGKVDLVSAVQSGVILNKDRPDDSDRYSFPLHEGDLLILGSDGLFDNLHEAELSELAGLTVSPMEAQQVYMLSSKTLRGPGASTDPGHLATALAHAAYFRACDGNAKTPFAEHAQLQGISHMGGKLDDITVVCAWAVPALPGD